MTSIFFQISNKDFLEASKIYNMYNNKQFAIRIISFQNGMENIIYLPEVTLDELSVLASIFRVKIIPNLRSLDDLRRLIGNIIYYY